MNTAEVATPTRNDAPEYTSRPARYSRGNIAVQCPGVGGWKTRAGRLAEAVCRGRYTNREKSYIMTPSQFKKFEKLYAEGWDANSMTWTLYAPGED